MHMLLRHMQSLPSHLTVVHLSSANELSAKGIETRAISEQYCRQSALGIASFEMHEPVDACAVFEIVRHYPVPP